MKDKIKKFLRECDTNFNTDNESLLVELIADCLNDLQPQWVSVGKEDNYAELMKAGSLTFWHKVHKCEVTGWIVKNELENLIQGEYSVIEMTKTVQWPIDAFTFIRAPSLPPNDGE
jgi:hypothetical protein